MENFQLVLGFPECKNAKPIVETIDVPCPVCGSKVQVRKTKRKRNYYICENNPDSCNYISWNKPKIGEKWEPKEKDEALDKVAEPKAKKTTKKKGRKSKRASKKQINISGINHNIIFILCYDLLLVMVTFILHILLKTKCYQLMGALTTHAMLKCYPVTKFKKVKQSIDLQPNVC